MDTAQTNLGITSAQRRRAARVTDAVVADYLNTISRRREAVADRAPRIRAAGAQRPLRRRPNH